MTYLIGTDEAGYGPNLGPLVVSATVWQAPDGTPDLYRLLDRAIAPAPERRVGGGLRRVAIADSKVLYQSGKGLALLERGLWTAFALLGHRPATLAEAWDLLAPEARQERQSLPGHLDFDAPAPLDADAEELASLAPLVEQTLAAAGVRLLAVRSRVIFPEQFNESLSRHASKGTALSHWTLDLAARLVESLPDDEVSVVCDKHGGRDRYGPLLAEFFPEWLIEVRGEGRAQSTYRFGPPERRVEFCFRAKGESHLPTALASMASKYLREVAMRALNAFWRRHVPELAPTAGYPQDAARFKAQIAAAQRRLGIADRVLWRVK